MGLLDQHESGLVKPAKIPAPQPEPEAEPNARRRRPTGLPRQRR